MYYKIVKTLGKVSAILSDNIPQQGICLEFRNIQDQNYSILVYQDGELKDLCLNGWTFPYTFNKISLNKGKDYNCGLFYYIVYFESIDPTGSEQHIDYKKIYGDIDLLAIEYFFTLLYNISCCENFEQYKDLYKYVYDTNWANYHDKNFAQETISFIDKFTPHLSNLTDVDYLSGLKRRIDFTRKMAADRIKAKG